MNRLILVSCMGQEQRGAGVGDPEQGNWGQVVLGRVWPGRCGREAGCKEWERSEKGGGGACCVKTQRPTLCQLGKMTCCAALGKGWGGTCCRPRVPHALPTALPRATAAS